MVSQRKLYVIGDVILVSLSHSVLLSLRGFCNIFIGFGSSLDILLSMGLTFRVLGRCYGISLKDS